MKHLLILLLAITLVPGALSAQKAFEGIVSYEIKVMGDNTTNMETKNLIMKD